MIESASTYMLGAQIGMLWPICLLFLFQIKHLVIDFFLQVPYMWMNKGKLLHPGGWYHAWLHGIGSVPILYLGSISNDNVLATVGFIALMEVLLHFTIDFLKVNINERMHWKPDTSEEFWYLLGADQFLHQSTYIVMVLALWVY